MEFPNELNMKCPKDGGEMVTKFMAILKLNGAENVAGYSLMTGNSTK